MRRIICIFYGFEYIGIFMGILAAVIRQVEKFMIYVDGGFVR